jgi:hypothetical protein
VFAVSLLVQFVPGLNSIITGQAAIFPALTFTLPEPIGDVLGLFGLVNLFDWNWLTGLLGLGSISILYLGWLASWWVRHPGDSPTIATSSQRSQ